jgi:hypothetical protein
MVPEAEPVAGDVGKTIGKARGANHAASGLINLGSRDALAYGGNRRLLRLADNFEDSRLLFRWRTRDAQAGAIRPIAIGYNPELQQSYIATPQFTGS